MTLRMVFSQADNIVKVAGRQDNQLVSAALVDQLLRGTPDAAKVRNVMRRIFQFSNRCCHSANNMSVS